MEKEIEGERETKRNVEIERKGENKRGGRSPSSEGPAGRGEEGVEERAGKGRKKKGPGNNWPRGRNARAALIFSRSRTRKPFYAHPRLIILHTRKMKLAANKGTPRALLGGPRARERALQPPSSLLRSLFIRA